jgi:hypothetical protein
MTLEEKIMADDLGQSGMTGDQAEDSDAGMQGRIVSDAPVGTTPSHERPSFQDPVPENMDPTEPGSPEQELNK